MTNPIKHYSTEWLRYHAEGQYEDDYGYHYDAVANTQLITAADETEALVIDFQWMHKAMEDGLIQEGDWVNVIREEDK